MTLYLKQEKFKNGHDHRQVKVYRSFLFHRLPGNWVYTRWSRKARHQNNQSNRDRQTITYMKVAKQSNTELYHTTYNKMSLLYDE